MGGFETHLSLAHLSLSCNVVAPSEGFRFLSHSSPVFCSRFLYHEQDMEVDFTCQPRFFPFSVSYLGTFSMWSSSNQTLCIEALGIPTKINSDVPVPVAAPLLSACEGTEGQAQ